MVRHIAMFRFRDDVSEDAIVALRQRLRALPEAVETIRAYQVGSDLSLTDGTWDMVVVGDFADIDAYRAYASHPAHIAVVQDLLTMISDRAAIQVDHV